MNFKLDRWNGWMRNSLESYARVMDYYIENKLTYYHRPGHIYDCLSLLYDESLRNFITSELKFALLYHDVMYDPKAKDNEENSAALAVIDLSDVYRYNEVGLNKIVELILLKKHTGTPTDDSESQCMLDVDLSILGSEPYKYKSYADGIRREYSFVSDDDYRRGRVDFLTKLLQRPKIYYKLTRLEELARTNIQNEIMHLRGQF